MSEHTCLPLLGTVCVMYASDLDGDVKECGDGDVKESDMDDVDGDDGDVDDGDGDYWPVRMVT